MCRHTHQYWAVTTSYSHTSQQCYCAPTPAKTRKQVMKNSQSAHLFMSYQLWQQQSVTVNNPKLLPGQLHEPKVLLGMLTGEAVPQLQAGLAGRFNYGWKHVVSHVTSPWFGKWDTCRHDAHKFFASLDDKCVMSDKISCHIEVALHSSNLCRV